MDQAGLYQWLESSFSSLPKANDRVFQSVWAKGGLRFSEIGVQPDLIDKLNAQLVCTVLAERRQLLVVLPDYAPNRGAFLLSTALIIDSADRIQGNIRGGQVLYFGSTVGIREHIGKVSLNKLPLDSVFSQKERSQRLQATQIPKGRSDKRNTGSFNLPSVLCIYAPGDPAAVCRDNKSNWIAVDCGDKGKLRWIKPLTEYAVSHNIPLIAWIQNPLSLVVDEFKESGGEVFIWPSPEKGRSLPSIKAPLHDGLHALFNSQERSIWPVAVSSSSDNIGIELLHQAYIALSRVNIEKAGRIVIGTTQLCWRYLRAMENLCVPLEFFEAESESFWGVSNLARISQALDKYIQSLAVNKSSYYGVLGDIQGYLRDAHEWFEKGNSVLWNALANICVDNIASGTARLLVFPTQANRKLFSLALLAYHNVTEDDLKKLRVGLITLHDLYDLLTLSSQSTSEQVQVMRLLSGLPSADLDWQYLVVGLPSWTATSYLSPMLKRQDIRVVLYPYQETALVRRVERWNSLIYPNIVECADALALVAKKKRPNVDPFDIPPKLRVRSSDVINIQSPTKTSNGDERKAAWQHYDFREEAALLMNAELDYEESSFDLAVNTEESGAVKPHQKSEFVEVALRVEFITGEYLYFSIDDKVNVVMVTNKGVTTDERYVASLRTGDRIVYIHGQRRQSLLDLIISRVYRNPAVNLHVKLVERWQEDFAIAHYKKAKVPRAWNVSQWTLDSLFAAMKDQGSKISDAQPLRNWLNGETLRPQDPEDLKRLAIILDMDFVREHYLRIHRAGGRLHGLRSSLARRLNVWLSREVPGFGGTSDDQDDMIDEELGLSFKDFRDSLMVLKIKSVSKEFGLWTREMLGRVEGGAAI